MPTLAEIRAFVGGLSEVGALVAVQEAAAARLVELDAAKRPEIFPAASDGSTPRSPRPACAV